MTASEPAMHTDLSRSFIMTPHTFDTVAGILMTDFHLDTAKVTPATRLLDLDLHSLAIMEFVFAVEDAFDLRIPQERLDPRDAGITLEGLCELVDQMAAAAHGNSAEMT
jgi:acyl carrier protein